jgi:MerR family transcriptional regulator, light-induced transcriptional regulator
MKIGELSKATGISEDTLRAWERRHGVPHAHRGPGGQRRYGANAPGEVKNVSRLRETGLSLAAATDQVKHSRDVPRSIFAGIRRRRPDTETIRISQPVMLALSRAIEDEMMWRGEPIALVATFQTVAEYRRSARRWHELAQGAELAVVLSSFQSAKLGLPIAELPIKGLGRNSREWAVVARSSSFAACLAGWERSIGSRRDDGRREFEAIWTQDPSMVGAGFEAAAEIAEQTSSRHAQMLRSQAAKPLPTPDPASVSALARRSIEYLPHL